MKCGKKIFLQFVVLSVLIAAIPSVVLAQLPSGAQPIALTATLNESLTLSLDKAAVDFSPLTANTATNAGNTTVTATTKWVLKAGRTNVTVDAYFGNAAAALSGTAGNTVTIPSSAFFISDNGGPKAALVNTVAFGAANAGLRLENVAINGTNKNSGSTDVMAFNIDTTVVPQLPADTYSGTLNIQAQATP